MTITIDFIADHFSCDALSAKRIANILAGATNIKFIMPGMLTFLINDEKVVLTKFERWQLTRSLTKESDNIQDLV